jgi:hypothetical protein
MAEVMEHLPSKREALSSNLTTAKNKKIKKAILLIKINPKKTG